MEHDIEKLISKKIRETEEKTVLWNKANVWRKINAAQQPARTSRAFYYAAASLLFGLLFISYRISILQQRQVNLQLEALASAICRMEEGPRVDDADYTGRKMITPEICIKENTVQRNILKKNKNQEAEVIDALQTAVMQDTLSSKIILPENTPPTFAATNVAETPRKVRAIVGVIPKQDTGVVAQKEKKLMFHVFTPGKQEQREELNPDHTFIITRIN